MENRLSEQLRQAFAEAGDEFTIGDLMAKVDTRSYGLLLTLSPLPTALPFTPPGFTVPFSVLQMIVAGQMLIGKSVPWLPKWILNRRVVSKGKTSRMWGAMPGFMAKFERMLKPRLGWVYQGIGPNLLALAVILASLAMAVPFPVTNSVCAIGIFMIGLGYLEDDGGFGLVGGLISLLSFLFVFGLIVAVFFFGFKGIKFQGWWEV